jgi:DNA-binding transcriptional LysR family regulator
MKYPHISLEQWTTFTAVVEEGSYAKAAEALHKSQSAVSYAIAKLEEQLPTPVLMLHGRKAVLTEAGEVLYRRAQQLLKLATDVEQTAQHLADGWETRISIAVDAIIPVDPILAAIGKFTNEAPQTRVTLLETTLSGTDEALLERTADIVLSPRTTPGFMGSSIGNIQSIAVAHANYPLARSKHELSEQDLRQSRQIVVRDSGLKRKQDVGWLGAEQRITVSHFSTAIKAIEYGLGFGFVPETYVRHLLDAGTLKRLNLGLMADRQIPVYLILATPDHIGPATKLLIENLKQSFQPN